MFVHISGSIHLLNVTLRALLSRLRWKSQNYLGTRGYAADMKAAFPNGDPSHTHNSLEGVGLHVSVGCSHLLHANGNSG